MPHRRLSLEDKQRRMRERQAAPEPRSDDSTGSGGRAVLKRSTDRLAPSKRAGCRRSDTDLVFSNLEISDEAVLKLIDDWIVPELVEEFLGELHDEVHERSQSEDN